jgi:dipeptidyl aminopeptidase/acylaminoacyl peptidase
VVPLNEVGPWLLGVADEGVVAMNPDGTGRTVLFSGELDRDPPVWLNLWWDAASTDTGWIAVRAPGDEGSNGSPRLLLARLPGTEPIREIPILSPEHAARMQDLDEDGSSNLWSADEYLALHGEGSFRTLSWSPDGRLLAFVATIDGPSADAYVYDTEIDQVRRLTDGPNQPKLVGWSPDSRWVLHLEIKDIFLGDGIFYDDEGLWAAAADGSGSKRIQGVSGSLLLAGWLSPTRLLGLHYGSGPLPPYRMEVVDLNSGLVRTLYPGTLLQWAVDPGSDTLAFVAEADAFREEDTLRPGLYIVSTTGGAPRLVGFDDPVDESRSGLVAELQWSSALSAFLVRTGADWIVAMSPPGEIIREFEGECTLPLVSPDRRWLAFGSCFDRDGIRILDEQDGRVRQLTSEEFHDLTWHPDSSGLFYFQGRNPARLMFVGVLEGTPRLVHPNPGFDNDLDVLGWRE